MANPYVKISSEMGVGSLYYNYKNYFWIVLQAVCSADYMFLYVDVRGFRQRNDGGTFVGLHFGQVFQNGTLNVSTDDVLLNTHCHAIRISWK